MLFILRSIRSILLRFRATLPRQSPLILRRHPRSILEGQNRPDLPQRRRRRPIPIQAHHRTTRLPLARRAPATKRPLGPRRNSSHQSHHRRPRLRQRDRHPILLWPRGLHAHNIVPQGPGAATARPLHDLGAAGRDLRVDENARECEAALGVFA